MNTLSNHSKCIHLLSSLYYFIKTCNVKIYLLSKEKGKVNMSAFFYKKYIFYIFIFLFNLKISASDHTETPTPSTRHVNTTQPTSYLYRLVFVPNEQRSTNPNYSNDVLNYYLNLLDQGALSEFNHEYFSRRRMPSTNNIPYSAVLNNYIQSFGILPYETRLLSVVFSAEQLLNELRYIRYIALNPEEITARNELLEIEDRPPTEGTWLIQEILPRNIALEQTRGTGFENMNLWSSLNDVGRRSLQEILGGEDGEGGRVPYLEELVAPFFYLPQPIAPPEVIRRFEEFSPMIGNFRTRMIDSGNNWQRPLTPSNFGLLSEEERLQHYDIIEQNRILRTVLERFLSRTIPPFSHGTWLYTLSALYYYQNTIFPPGESPSIGSAARHNIVFPREFVRRTFIGRVNSQGEFILAQRELINSNVIQNSQNILINEQTNAVDNRNFIGLNATENYWTNSRLLAFLGLPSEQPQLPVVAEGQEEEVHHNVQAVEEPHDGNRFFSSLRRFFPAVLQYIYHTCANRRHPRSIGESVNRGDSLSNEKCQSTFVSQNPNRVAGSLFQMSFNNDSYSTHYLTKSSNNIYNSYLFTTKSRYIEKANNIFEVALTEDGLYKIISLGSEANNNVCLTRTAKDGVAFKSCNSTLDKKQKWDITKVESKNNSFEAKITQDDGCLFVQKFNLVFDKFCNFKNSQAQTFTFTEYKKSNLAQLSLYTHSILLENRKDKKLDSQYLNNKEGYNTNNVTEWKILIGNPKYQGYQLTNLEGLKQFKPAFSVVKSTDFIPFYLTQSGKIYTTIEGRESMPLCLTGSDVKEARWQHIGFRPCDKSLDKYQQWDLSSIFSKVNSNGEIYSIQNLKLKSSDTCLRMKNRYSNWGELFLSKCNEYTDNSYSLQLVFTSVKKGKAFTADLNLSYRPLKHKLGFVAPTNKQWAYLYSDSNWVFRYDSDSMRMVGYDRNDLETNSVSCLRKNDGNNLFKVNTLNDIKGYTYLKIVLCEKNIHPEEQFFLILKPAKKGEIEFVVYSPLQKEQSTSLPKLMQNYNYLNLIDPNKMLCTGESGKYLWMGYCERDVQKYWNDEAFFHWEYL